MLALATSGPRTLPLGHGVHCCDTWETEWCPGEDGNGMMKDERL